MRIQLGHLTQMLGLKQAEPLGTKTSIGTLPPKDGWEVAKKKRFHIVQPA